MSERSGPDELRAVPLWLILCVWVMIGAAWLLQSSISSALNRQDEWKVVALDWAPWLALAPLILWVSTRWPIGQRSWMWALPIHIVLSLVLSFSLGALAWHSVARFGPPNMAPAPMRLMMPPPPPDEEAPPPRGEGMGPFSFSAQPPPGLPAPPTEIRGRRRAEAAHFPILFVLTRGRGLVFFYWALLGVAHAVTYYRRSQLRERDALAAEARLAEAKLTALQAQLHPHFLFNTLNAISSKLYESPPAADAMLCSLSDLLRRVLAASGRREVALAEEISLAKSYVAIQQVRFGDALQVRWDVPETTLNASVPTLLLQPLIENAVVHAVERQEGRGEILIRAERAGDRLKITIRDTGPGHEWSNASEQGPAKGTGTGLSNTRARLQELYRTDHQFSLSVEPGAGAEVRIDIPFRILA